MTVKKWLIVGMMFAFLVMGVLSMQRAVPDAKSERIYKELKVYTPYTLEKRIGGLTIVDKRDGRKEKPSAAEVLHRLDELEKEWGAEHLKIENSDLLVLGDNNQTIVKIFIETQEEREFLHNFFGL
ncbi:MAG: hypothetical protein PF439_10110 [Helicobacteraceae bacterium]|nr:hypothetical protein [Helicobacteraceae bacterium]